MADLSWLRIGPRSRTPVVSRSPTSSERNSVPELDDHRTVIPSRVSSYLSLHSRTSMSPEPLTPSSNSTLLVKAQDRVWHNPSLCQMVEALQVTILTHGVLSPIPVQYNSYVLHLIEGFDNIQEKLDVANTALAEIRLDRDHALEDVKKIAEEWSSREAQFKKEVKRLEVLLAKTSSDGLETVTLARTDSAVDRGMPDPLEFVSRLQRPRSQTMSCRSKTQVETQPDYQVFLGQTHTTDGNVMRTLEQIEDSKYDSDSSIETRSTAALPMILDRQHDFMMSERFRRQDAAASNSILPRERLQTRRPYSYLRKANTDLRAMPDEGQILSKLTATRALEGDPPEPGSTSCIPEPDGEDEETIVGQPDPQQKQRHVYGSVGLSTQGRDTDPLEPPWKPHAGKSAHRRMEVKDPSPCRGSFGFTRRSRFSFVAGEDTCRVAAGQATHYQANTSGHGSVDAPGHVEKDLRQYEQNSRFEDDLEPNDRRPLPSKHPSASPELMAAAKSLRHGYRQPTGGKAALGSNSAGNLQAGTWEAVEMPPRLQSRDSTGSVGTVVRDGSSRSNISIDTISGSGTLVKSKQSPTQQKQRQNSAQIAAARAVARNKQGESGLHK